VLVGCYYGYTVRGGPVQVGRATAKAMVVNLSDPHHRDPRSQLFWRRTPTSNRRMTRGRAIAVVALGVALSLSRIFFFGGGGYTLHVRFETPDCSSRARGQVAGRKVGSIKRSR